MQKKKKIVVIMAIALGALVHWLVGIQHTSIGIYDGCPWWHHLTYQFFHASVFHAAVNAYVIYLCFDKFAFPSRVLLMCFVASALSPSFGALPTIGASGFAYALIGVINSLVRREAYFAFCIMAQIALTAFLQCNWALHAFCYVLGFLIGHVNLVCKRLRTY